MMTAALVLAPGPYQILINVPWNGEDIESIVRQLRLILGQPPEMWPNVESNPQVRGLGPPPIRQGLSARFLFSIGWAPF
jgi:hypothetical protein